MTEQYPHYLFLVHPGLASEQDGRGDWSESKPFVEFKSVCRDEPNGAGEGLPVGDGTYYTYASVVYMPAGVSGIAEGDPVLLANDADGQHVRTRATVLKFDSGELHCRMWIE